MRFVNTFGKLVDYFMQCSSKIFCWIYCRVVLYGFRIWLTSLMGFLAPYFHYLLLVFILPMFRYMTQCSSFTDYESVLLSSFLFDFNSSLRNLTPRRLDLSGPFDLVSFSFLLPSFGSGLKFLRSKEVILNLGWYVGLPKPTWGLTLPKHAPNG